MDTNNKGDARIISLDQPIIGDEYVTMFSTFPIIFHCSLQGCNCVLTHIIDIKSYLERVDANWMFTLV